MTALAPLRPPTATRRWQDVVTEHADRLTVLGMSKDGDAKIVAMLFDEGVRTPVSVAKIPTTRPAECAVLREAVVVERVRARLTPALCATVPVPLALIEHQGRLAIVLSALDGTPGLTRYHSWRHTARPSAVQKDFAAAASWLQDFQQSTAGPNGPVELLEGAQDAIAKRFSGEDDIGRDLANIDAIASRLRNCHTVRTAVHGDFWFGNLLFKDDCVAGVVDWEMGTPSDGEPVHDLARFVLAYSLYLDRHARPSRPVPGHPGLRAGMWGAGVQWALDGHGWYPELVRSFLVDGLSRLGVPPEHGRDVVLAELVTVAVQANDDDFAREHLRLLRRLIDVRRA